MRPGTVEYQLNGTRSAYPGGSSFARRPIVLPNSFWEIERNVTSEAVSRTAEEIKFEIFHFSFSLSLFVGAPILWGAGQGRSGRVDGAGDEGVLLGKELSGNNGMSTRFHRLFLLCLCPIGQAGRRSPWLS